MLFVAEVPKKKVGLIHKNSLASCQLTNCVLVITEYLNSNTNQLSNQTRHWNQMPRRQYFFVKRMCRWQDYFMKRMYENVLRIQRAFIYSDWFVCSVCFCSLLPRLTLLLSFFGHSALPPPRGGPGSASRVSPQSCQSHESLWVSWYSRLLSRLGVTITRSFLDGYCSTVQDLLDWFEVDLGFTELSFIQIDLCVLCVFVLYSRVSLSSCPLLDILHCLPRAVGVPLKSALNLVRVSPMSPCGAHDTHAYCAQSNDHLLYWLW